MILIDLISEMKGVILLLSNTVYWPIREQLRGFSLIGCEPQIVEPPLGIKELGCEKVVGGVRDRILWNVDTGLCRKKRV
jgi:hypothetical protein